MSQVHYTCPPVDLQTVMDMRATICDVYQQISRKKKTKTAIHHSKHFPTKGTMSSEDPTGQVCFFAQQISDHIHIPLQPFFLDCGNHRKNNICA